MIREVLRARIPGYLGASNGIALQLARRFGELAVYGLAFTLLRLTSNHWAAHQLFSVWFPAAGLRFAFLWLRGAAWTPAAAAAELIASVGLGTVVLTSPIALSLIGVVGPCLVYGVVIHIVRARSASMGGSDEFEPIPVAMAAILAPMGACFAALPWAIPLSLQHGQIHAPALLSALLVFVLGDLLGILVLGPPLLWLANRWQRFHMFDISAAVIRRLLEGAAVLCCAWALVRFLSYVGDGLVLAPVLLAACWCGLRGGRLVAWAAILSTALVVLPMTASGMGDAVRVQVHMQLACVAVGAFLAGSYADAQKRSLEEIRRRDRLLFHAERLKSLRGMSLAVIHELSQPLSTIAIEARALARVGRDPAARGEDLPEISALIARKADDLTDLIKRLRAFGSSSGDGNTSVRCVSQLLEEAIALAATEAKDAGVEFLRLPGPRLRANVHDVEYRQALLNLLRNAIAATAVEGSVVELGSAKLGRFAEVWVQNETNASASPRRGMGLGLIIARTIAEAHGGSLVLERATGGVVRAAIRVPLYEGNHE